MPMNAYERLINAYLDSKPIISSSQSPAVVERDQAFFTHPIWESVPQAVLDHELFAVAYAHYFRQEPVSNTGLLRRALALAPQAVMRAIRYAQLCLNLDSPRWREVVQLKQEGSAELRDFIKVQEIINKAYRLLKQQVQHAEQEVRALSAIEVLFYVSLSGFRSFLPERIYLEQRWREAIPNPSAPISPTHRLFAEQAALDQTYQLTLEAIRAILMWKLRTRPEHELELTEEVLGALMEKHLKPFLDLPSPIPAKHAARLDAVSRLIQAHIELRDFLDRSADSYCFNTDFNLILSPCRRSTVIDPATPQTSTWARDGKKMEYLEQYWFARAAIEFHERGLAEADIGREENREQNRFAVLKALQAEMVLAEVYGISDAVVLENGLRVDIFKAVQSAYLTLMFFQVDFLQPFATHLQQTGNWRAAMSILALEGLMNEENRLPLTWSTRSQKARSLIGWTVCDQFPNGDLATSESILAFWSLDLAAWAARLRANSRADLPDLYEQPYLQGGEYLVQLPWLVALGHPTHAAINQLRLRHKHRRGLMEETRSIEAQLGQLLQAREFHVVMNYHPPYSANEDDPGEVDVIAQRDGHLFVIEVKSTYVRKDFREVWQHKYQTLHRAGSQLAKKRRAIIETIRQDRALSERLGMPWQQAPTAIHSWIVDTSIELDHTSFSGQLKVSLEELLIVLRNERDLLYRWTMGDADFDLYPDGFSAARFAAMVEGDELWSMLKATSQPGVLPQG